MSYLSFWIKYGVPQGSKHGSKLFVTFVCLDFLVRYIAKELIKKQTINKFSLQYTYIV